MQPNSNGTKMQSFVTFILVSFNILWRENKKIGFFGTKGEGLYKKFRGLVYRFKFELSKKNNKSYRRD